MPEDFKFSVRTNIEALNASVLHGALVTMVRETVRAGKEFLRADRATHHGTGSTEKHIESEETGELSGKFGITPLVEQDERKTYGKYRHSQAPLFVDGGTRARIFAAREGGLMWNRADGIFGRKEVRGQPGQHFVAKTYAETQLLLRENKSIDLALEAMEADAAALLAAIEAE